MNKKALRIIVFILLLFSCMQAVSCGTILYPERRGQTGGEIDPGIALLDGLLLLVVVIPGVIAFAVDLTTGAIFKPSGKSASVEFEKSDELIEVELPPGFKSDAALEKKLQAKTGSAVSLADCRSYRLKSEQSIQGFLKSNHFKLFSGANH